MADTVLYETRFISLIDRDGYVFTHEKRSDGQIVSLLPFRDGGDGREYLARIEICPAHGPEPEQVSITGGVDPGRGVRETALAELHEEAGYRVEDSALIALGTVRPSKSADTTVHLFAIDVTGLTAEQAMGDGSRFEIDSGTKWVTLDTALQNRDPLFIAALARLNQARPPR